MQLLTRPLQMHQVRRSQHLLEGSTSEQQLKLAGRRVRQLEGQVQEELRRHKARLDDLTGQLEAARGVQQAWQRAVRAVKKARATAAERLEAARTVVREREQQVEAVRKDEAGLMLQLEEARVKLREEEEDAAAVAKAWDDFSAEVREAAEKLEGREQEVAAMPQEERADALLQLEAARSVLQEQEAAVAAVLEARGGLAGLLEAARGVVMECQKQVAAVKEAAEDFQLQLEAARGVVRAREEEVAAVEQVHGCVQFLQLANTVVPAEQTPPQQPHQHQQCQQQQQQQQPRSLQHPQLQLQNLGQRYHRQVEAAAPQPQITVREASHQQRTMNSFGRVSGTAAALLCTAKLHLSWHAWHSPCRHWLFQCFVSSNCASTYSKITGCCHGRWCAGVWWWGVLQL
jgi:chromosome segregation ATPase